MAAACTPSAPADPSVTVALAGDVHGESPIAEVLRDGANPLAGVAPLLSAADIAVVNLETPAARVGEAADKAFVFRADPVLLERLAEAGVDVVNLANNHGLDYGAEALLETAALAADAGLAVVGAGPHADRAYAPALFDTAAGRVAVLGFTQLVDDPVWIAGANQPGLATASPAERAVEAVAAAAAASDHVVVTVHWGQELSPCPNLDQTRLADRLAAAGADVITGHHPHVLQGVQERNGALVAYSLGNYAFYARTPETRQSTTLTVTFNASGVSGYELHPAMLDEHGQPQPVEGPEAQAVLDLIRTRSPGGGTCHARTWD